MFGGVGGVIGGAGGVRGCGLNGKGGGREGDGWYCGRVRPKGHDIVKQ